jgi:hypothetical protein
LVASFVDPRTKDMAYYENDDTSNIIDHVKKVLFDIAMEGVVAPICPLSPLAPPSADDNDSDEDNPMRNLFSNLKSNRVYPAEEEADENSREMIEMRIKNELNQYRTKMPQLDMMDQSGSFTNPLAWWKKRQHQLPLLSILAKRTLCIPATSAPSERVFSQAGLTISNLRCSLSAEHASNLIFLHDNWDIADKYQAKRSQLALSALAEISP